MLGRRKENKSGKTKYSSAGIVALIAAVVIILWNNYSDNPQETPKAANDIFYMCVIDVGQGDSILLSLGDYDILVDSGDGKSGESITGFLMKNGVEDIDMLVATHPHADHIGGMKDVFSKYTIKKVLMPEIEDDDIPTTATYEKFIDCITSSQANTDGEIYYAVPGDKYTFGELMLTVLSPASCSDDYNNDSVVLRVEYGETSFLLMGDAEKETEKELLNSGCTLSADVLKVGHHGSSSSTGEGFLTAVKPKYAVISCGRDNFYGHPHSETLAMLDKYSVGTARTDLTGTVIYTSNGKEVTCHT